MPLGGTEHGLCAVIAARQCQIRPTHGAASRVVVTINWAASGDAAYAGMVPTVTDVASSTTAESPATTLYATSAKPTAADEVNLQSICSESRSLTGRHRQSWASVDLRLVFSPRG